MQVCASLSSDFTSIHFFKMFIFPITVSLFLYLKTAIMAPESVSLLPPLQAGPCNLNLSGISGEEGGV